MMRCLAVTFDSSVKKDLKPLKGVHLRIHESIWPSFHFVLMCIMPTSNELILGLDMNIPLSSQSMGLIELPLYTGIEAGNSNSSRNSRLGLLETSIHWVNCWSEAINTYIHRILSGRQSMIWSVQSCDCSVTGCARRLGITLTIEHLKKKTKGKDTLVVVTSREACRSMYEAHRDVSRRLMPNLHQRLKVVVDPRAA